METMAALRASRSPPPVSRIIADMGAGLLAAIIVGSVLVIGGLVGGLLYFIFGAVRRAADREVAALRGEGIVLDSGPVHIRFRFRGFRGPMVAIGVGVRAGTGRVVLTQQRLTFVPSGRNRFGFARIDREGLSRFQVRSRRSECERARRRGAGGGRMRSAAVDARGRAAA